MRSGTRVRHRPSQTASRLSANKPPTGRALGKSGVGNRAVCHGPRPQASFVGRCDRVTTFSQTGSVPPPTLPLRGRDVDCGQQVRWGQQVEGPREQPPSWGHRKTLFFQVRCFGGLCPSSAGSPTHTPCPAQARPWRAQTSTQRSAVPTTRHAPVLEITLPAELRFPDCCEGSTDTLAGLHVGMFWAGNTHLPKLQVMFPKFLTY